MSEEIIVYTDGGCHGNPGPGGWGAVIIYDGNVQRLSGGEQLTTNNKMELTAAIMSLKTIHGDPDLRTRSISVYSDSQYVKNGITTWIKSWKAHNWVKSDKKPVLNKELWIALDTLNQCMNVSWNWVKGHAGVEYNEVCDQLCQMEIAKYE